ncbi:regucalcin-like isoform X2 [Chironomus tepperi]
MSDELHIEEITNETLRCILGEGPHYDVKSQNLYYVDIEAPAIFRYSLETGKIFKATIKDNNSQLGFITPIAGKTDEFVVGAGHDLTVIKWNGESEEATVQTVLVTVQSELPINRINDAKCDPHGRLFFGTMGDTTTNLKDHPTGFFYRYDNPNATVLRDSVGISNGLAWDEKLGKFYYIDSVTRNVKVYDYESSTGHISNESVLIDFAVTHPDIEFAPDGMTIDENGFLYVATWDGARIIIINPVSKEIVREIQMPVDKVTSLAFGGPSLDILFVTTAAFPTSDIHPPPSGAVFKITGLNVKGLPMSEFKLD